MEFRGEGTTCQQEWNCIQLMVMSCQQSISKIVRGESPALTITSLVNTMSNPLDQVPEVLIDSDGVFKYILINVSLERDLHGNEACKKIVRGNKRGEYHADIYEEECDKLHKLGLNCQCLGGGRIKHDPGSKKILVYGYSQGFGRADHQCTVDVLKKVYKTYDITFSDDGY